MSGIYIHIPFCKQACHYCNFHFSTSLNNRDSIIKSMLREIEVKSAQCHDVIETIYFGGGTPSLLEVKEIDNFIQLIIEIDYYVLRILFAEILQSKIKAYNTTISNKDGIPT